MHWSTTHLARSQRRPIATDKIDKHTRKPKLAPLRDLEIVSESLNSAKCTVEDGFITISVKQADGVMTLVNTVKTDSDNDQLPRSPGRNIQEDWDWMCQHGTSRIVFEAKARKDFGIVPVKIKSETFYYHPMCLTMNKTVQKNGEEKKKPKAVPHYVYFTLRRSMIVIPVTGTTIATRSILATLDAATAHSDSGEWPVPGSSPHTTGNVGAWLKTMDSKEYKHLVTPELRTAALEAWRDVDMYQMMMGVPCPPVLGGYPVATMQAITYYCTTRFQTGLVSHLIPLLYELFTAARKAHGL
jgi:hypothetical protein